MSSWASRSIIRLTDMAKISSQTQKKIREILTLKKPDEETNLEDIYYPEIDSTTKIETRGLSMPIIGFGTWQIEPFRMDLALSYALEAGYRHIDTAYSFGNEEAIGKTLETSLKRGFVKREDLFITSKLPFYGMTPEGVKHYVNKTLEFLKLSYLDLYLIHFPVGVCLKDGKYVPDGNTDHLKIWRALEEEVCQGRIRNLGVSNFNVDQVKKILKFAKIAPSNIQVELHVYHQQKEMLSFCSDNAIALTAYAPLGSPGLDQFLVAHELNFTDVPVQLKNPTVLKIARKHKKTPAHVLLRYLVQNGISVIPKSHNPDRIVRNFNIFDFSLDGDDMNELAGLDMEGKGQMFSNVWEGTERHPQYPFNQPEERNSL